MISYVWATGLALAVVTLACQAGFIAGRRDWVLYKVITLAFFYAALSLLTGHLSGIAEYSISQAFSFLGMATYLFLAGGLILLGGVLVKVFAYTGIDRNSGLWRLLLFSSPLYLLSIVMSVFLFTSISGAQRFRVGGILAGVFAFTVVSSARVFRKYKNIRVAKFLGFAMIMTGLYFIVSAGVVPVYTRAVSVVQISRDGSGFREPITKLIALLVSFFTIFLWGFLKKRKEFMS